MQTRHWVSTLCCALSLAVLAVACGGNMVTQPEIDDLATLTAAGNGNGNGGGKGGGKGGGDSLDVDFTEGDLSGSGTVIGEIKRSSKKGVTVKAGAVIGGGSPAGQLSLTINSVSDDPGSLNDCDATLLLGEPQEGKTFLGGFSLEIKYNVPRSVDSVHFLLADHDVEGVGNIRVQSGFNSAPEITDDGVTITVTQTGAGATLTTTNAAGEGVTCAVTFTMTVAPAQ